MFTSTARKLGETAVSDVPDFDFLMHAVYDISNSNLNPCFKQMTVIT
jgi:hypothetical protein